MVLLDARASKEIVELSGLVNDPVSLGLSFVLILSQTEIDQDGWNPARTATPWGENLLHLTPSQYSVTIPSGLKTGQYIIRHEVLGLHVASNLMGAQFYPNCVQISVVNGGSKTLPSSGKVALPGAYIPTDPGMMSSLNACVKG